MSLPTTKEELDKLIEDAKKGLVDKNNELLGKIKGLQKKIDSFEGVDLEALKKAATELKELKEAGDKEKGEYKKLYEELSTTSKAEADKSAATIKDLENQLTLSKKETQLSSALAKANVFPEMLESAKLLHLDKLGLDDKGVAMVGNKKLDDFISDWAKTDTGKRFVDNGNNGGGGNGPGGNTPPEADYYNPKSPNFNRTKQAEVANRDPKAHETYSKMFQKA